MDSSAYIKIMAETESNHWWFCARRVILAHLISSLSLPPHANILDVGCGTGGNLEMLATFGKLSAFEMDEIALNIALEKTKNQYDIKSGSCPNHIPFTEQRYDLICMFDVLEYIEQDVEALITIKPLLKKGGRLFITVPAYEWLYGTHDKFVHNKKRYSAKKMQKNVEQAGFKLIKMTYFNTLLFPLMALVRLKEKLMPNNTVPAGITMPSAVINYIFFKIFRFEKFLVPHFNLPFGASLLCVLEPV